MTHRIDPAAVNPDRVAVVVSTYNAWITKPLLAGAEAEYVRRGGDQARLAVVQVPGTYELTAACRELAASGAYDAVVALGCVIRGETPHFDAICQSVTHGLTEMTLRTGVPVGFGVLTCDTAAQAEARAGGDKGNKGAEAMAAAMDTAGVLDAVRAGTGTRRDMDAPDEHADVAREPVTRIGREDLTPGDAEPAPPPQRRPRSKAPPRQVRQLALLALYQLDSRGEEDAEAVSDNMPFAILSLLQRDDDDLPHHKGAAEPGADLSHMGGFDEGDLRIAYELARGAFTDREAADKIMLELAPDWPPNRQPTVDRCILRIAYHEMTTGRTPPKVAINEAVELAKRFSTDQSPLFVNGVLDKLMRTLRD
ncbi:MAG: 6,7-dimethyl-8-ribityllumazine synthase [Phycisphaerales bacterium]|nr:6,7-dimethyl-8-ribityllumazine synthase [Phycisphaerales bacterium]